MWRGYKRLRRNETSDELTMTRTHFVSDRRLVWHRSVIRTKQSLIARLSPNYTKRLSVPESKWRQAIILAHYKDLSTFLSHMVNGFNARTNHAAFLWLRGHENYKVEIMLDEHSWIEFRRLQAGALLPQINRDPRDLVAPSTLYNQRFSKKVVACFARALL